MAKILEVLKFPSPVLKKKSRDVEKVTSNLSDFVQDMFETMYNEEGIGLAAPQVGENLNILVMDVGQPDPKNEDKLISNPLCLINPRIVSREGQIVYDEGCLSCPELLVQVPRSQNIVVEALDAEGRLVTYNLQDLTAVCTQHEMDHLAGKLLTDYLSQLKRDMYRKQRVRQRRDDDDVGDL